MFGSVMISRIVLLRALSPIAARTCTMRNLTRSRPHISHAAIRSASHASSVSIRWSSSLSPADEKIEEITELYATAKDEFEIATEETDAMTVYAEEDRKAAREELTKVQAAYRAVVEGPDQALAQEVQRRIGQRIRELEQGVAALEERATQHD